MLESRIPLFVVNPSSKAVPQFKEILFPTDLSKNSHDAFRKVIELASAMKAKLFIYHKVEYVIPDTYAMIHQSPAYDQYLHDDGKERLSDLEKWLEIAKNKGLKAEIIFDKKPSYVTDSINKVAKKMKNGLIAMSSSSGAVESVVLGSIARQVIRSAPCPTWVIHSH